MSKHRLHISDEDLKTLLPGYLERKREEMSLLTEFFKNKNYEPAQSIAHNIKGTAASYGLPVAGEFAEKLEDALRDKNYSGAQVHFESLYHYIMNLEVIYEP